MICVSDLLIELEIASLRKLAKEKQKILNKRLYDLQIPMSIKNSKKKSRKTINTPNQSVNYVILLQQQLETACSYSKNWTIRRHFTKAKSSSHTSTRVNLDIEL